MFQIYADENLIYDSRLEGYSITKGQLTLEVNRSGAFVFTLYNSHPYFDRIEKLSTIVTVYRDDSLIYRGRVIKSVDGFYNDKTFTCEGELSFFLDSIQRPYAFTGSPEDLFNQFIDEHNSQVGEDKQFTVGTITVTDLNDYINRSNSSYEDTLENLSGKLLETLGGYLTITAGEDGERVINWLADFPRTGNVQAIEFGENLLNFTKQNSAEGLITALIPLGAKIQTGEEGDEERRVTIESVTEEGVDYVYDEEAVAKYGWIFGVHIWDDVTQPINLLHKADAYLQELINLNISIELTAIDLSAMNRDINAFTLGDYVPVISRPHNIDAEYLLTKQSIDLLHPENNKITLGYTFSTFTDTTLSNSVNDAGLKDKVETIENNYVTSGQINDELAALADMITQAADSITIGILEEYATNDQAAEAVSTLYDQLRGALTSALATVRASVNQTDANAREELEELRSFIRMDNGDIIIGSADNEIRLRIEDDKISIYDGGAEAAYVTGHKLHVTEADVSASLNIGNYALIPQPGGNLSLLKVR